MKNVNLLVVLSIAILSACTKDVNSGNKEMPKMKGSPEFTDIISESGLNGYLLNTANRTWHDLDNFYLSGIEKYQNRPEISNFKCAAIQGMTDFYKMLDDKSDTATERVSFYAEEMAGLKNCNPNVLHSMLVRLQGHWEQSKIARVASTGYKNAMILTNVMSKTIPEYEIRKKGMEDLASLTEIKK